jgi:hypothetical protein
LVRGETLFYLGSSGCFMRSFIKVMGPPLLEAVRALEKIAVDMPQVCVMDEAILLDVPRAVARDIGEPFEYPDYVSDFFTRRTGVSVKTERCHNIISESGEELGEYDFFFEWFEEPSLGQLNQLVEKVDAALGPLGCLYSITTRK